MQSFTIAIVYWICLFVSIGGLFLASHYNADPLHILLVSLIPLILYHFYLISIVIIKKTISHDTTDSIYYFGFLITISTLAVAIITIPNQEYAKHLDRIALQFGLGLIATGYALFARLTLISFSESQQDLKIDETIKEYLRKIRELITEVEISSDSFKNYTDTLKKETVNLINDAENRHNEILISTLNTYKDNVKIIMEDLKNSIAGIVEDIRNANISEEIKTIKEGAKTLSGSFLNISNRIKSLINLINDASVSITDNNTAVRNMSKEVEIASVKIQRIADINKEIESTKIIFDNLNKSGDLLSQKMHELYKGVGVITSGLLDLINPRIESLVSIIHMTANSFSEISSITTDSSEKMAEFNKAIELARNSVKELNTLYEKLNDRYREINEKVEAFVLEIDKIKSLTEAMGGLNIQTKVASGEVKQLALSINNLSVSIQEICENMNKDIKEQTNIASEAVSKMTGSFIKMVDYIIQNIEDKK